VNIQGIGLLIMAIFVAGALLVSSANSITDPDKIGLRLLLKGLGIVLIIVSIVIIAGILVVLGTCFGWFR
jgi:hypothetical protein